MREHEAYAPPLSRLAADVRPRRSSLNAVLVGFLVACAGTTVGGFLLRLATLLNAVQVRFDHLQLDIAMRQSLQAIGVLATLAGGYVCARLAGRRELTLGATQGLIALAVGYLIAVGEADALAEPRYLAVAFGSGVLGGMLGRIRNRDG